MINVSVFVTTLNEAANLPRCLKALRYFDEVIVVDSGSSDKTIMTASKLGARVESFRWKGGYPKKRQYCLEYIKTKHDYIFFVDADEEVTPELVAEIIQLDFKKAGYFVKGKYFWNGKALAHGLENNKLVLFDKNKIEFPVVKDLDDFCMGEMEGHYQPVLKEAHKGEKIGQIKNALIHYACEDKKSWAERHLRYAKWEAGMIVNDLYPKEDDKNRELFKRLYRKMPCRGVIAFVHSYIYKLGFLDGRAGIELALSRSRYYQMVSAALKANSPKEKSALKDKRVFASEK